MALFYPWRVSLASINNIWFLTLAFNVVIICRVSQMHNCCKAVYSNSNRQKTADSLKRCLSGVYYRDFSDRNFNAKLRIHVQTMTIAYRHLCAIWFKRWPRDRTRIVLCSRKRFECSGLGGIFELSSRASRSTLDQNNIKNSLPTATVLAPSVNSFKIKLSNHDFSKFLIFQSAASWSMAFLIFNWLRYKC